ncbi:MAG: GNAT family N-acetyltransferase, partial [Roseicyclus sp.]
RAGVAEGAADLSGAVLFSPCFSTMRGGPGLFVSDLWVAPDARRQRLGAALLGHAARAAQAEWGARFLRLMVYESNTEARAFYARAGFEAADGEIFLTLSGAAFHDLEGTG